MLHRRLRARKAVKTALLVHAARNISERVLQRARARR